mgnify:CR=1 FL=1
MGLLKTFFYISATCFLLGLALSGMTSCDGIGTSVDGDGPVYAESSASGSPVSPAASSLAGLGQVFPAVSLHGY